MPSRNPIAAYASHPLNTFFEVQDPNEKIVLLLRRHVVTNVPWLLATIILVLIPFAVTSFSTELVTLFPPLELFIQLPVNQLALLRLLYLLGVFYFALNSFMSWFFNVLLVTNTRVLDLDFRPPFHRNVAEAQLTEVQDVRNTQSGLLAVLFNMGNLFLQTAGRRQDIELLNVPQPGKVHDVITDLLSNV